MDLTLDVEDYKLNVRSGGVIIHNNKILTHRNINKDHYCLPGGRIEIGESSEQTIKREIYEELGKEIEITGYLATIENFFEMENKKYHEIFFLHRIEFENEEDKKINYTMHNVEGKEYLQYEWLDLDKIEEYNILPKCLKEVLKSQNFPIHVINDDLK
jgi:8-oxo-dGTP pyrophosphatase MutT (NUDIX family)